MADKDKEDESLAPADPLDRTDRSDKKPTTDQQPLSKIARRFLSRGGEPRIEKPTRNVDLEETARGRKHEPEHPGWIKKAAPKAKAKPARKIGPYLQMVRTRLGLTEAEFEAALRGWLDQPSTKSVAIPEQGPELWSDRSRSADRETPPEFVRRVYAPWIGRGLTRAHIRQLDLPLYRALSAWMSRHPEDELAGLPSLSESIDQKVARLSAEFTPDELRRLGLALQNRARRM